MRCNFGVLFSQQVGTDCTVPSNHVRLRRIRPFRHLIPQVPYCTYSSDDVLLLLMMMIHNLLDLIKRARTLWFIVHGSILLYRNYVHITCTSLSNHALLFVINYCYESLHCVSLLLPG